MMNRFFGGGGGKKPPRKPGIGSGNAFAGLLSKGMAGHFSKKATSYAEALKARSGASSLQDYKEMLQAKEVERLKKGPPSKTLTSVGNRGTRAASKEEEQHSKGYEKAIKELAIKKMLQEQRARTGQGVEIKAKNFMGKHPGRIDAKGRIYNKENKIILTVDLKTGKIKNHLGVAVGKYNAKSATNDFRIEKLLEKYSGPNKPLF